MQPHYATEWTLVLCWKQVPRTVSQLQGVLFHQVHARGLAFFGSPMLRKNAASSILVICLTTSLQLLIKSVFLNLLNPKTPKYIWLNQAFISRFYVRIKIFFINNAPHKSFFMYLEVLSESEVHIYLAHHLRNHTLTSGSLRETAKKKKLLPGH